MPKSNSDSTTQARYNELHELLLRREQEAFDRLQKITDNYETLQHNTQKTSMMLEETKIICSDLRSRQKLAIERLHKLRASLL